MPVSDGRGGYSPVIVQKDNSRALQNNQMVNMMMLEIMRQFGGDRQQRAAAESAIQQIKEQGEQGLRLEDRRTEGQVRLQSMADASALERQRLANQGGLEMTKEAGVQRRLDLDAQAAILNAAQDKATQANIIASFTDGWQVSQDPYLILARMGDPTQPGGSLMDEYGATRGATVTQLALQRDAMNAVPRAKEEGAAVLEGQQAKSAALQQGMEDLRGGSGGPPQTLGGQQPATAATNAAPTVGDLARKWVKAKDDLVKESRLYDSIKEYNLSIGERIGKAMASKNDPRGLAKDVGKFVAGTATLGATDDLFKSSEEDWGGFIQSTYQRMLTPEQNQMLQFLSMKMNNQIPAESPLGKLEASDTLLAGIGGTKGLLQLRYAVEGTRKALLDAGKTQGADYLGKLLIQMQDSYRPHYAADAETRGAISTYKRYLTDENNTGSPINWKALQQDTMLTLAATNKDSLISAVNESRAERNEPPIMEAEIDQWLQAVEAKLAPEQQKQLGLIRGVEAEQAGTQAGLSKLSELTYKEAQAIERTYEMSGWVEMNKQRMRLAMQFPDHPEILEPLDRKLDETRKRLNITPEEEADPTSLAGQVYQYRLSKEPLVHEAINKAMREKYKGIQASAATRLSNDPNMGIKALLSPKPGQETTVTTKIRPPEPQMGPPAPPTAPPALGPPQSPAQQAEFQVNQPDQPGSPFGGTAPPGTFQPPMQGTGG